VGRFCYPSASVWRSQVTSPSKSSSLKQGPVQIQIVQYPILANDGKRLNRALYLIANLLVIMIVYISTTDSLSATATPFHAERGIECGVSGDDSSISTVSRHHIMAALK
jgi:hypothetical protein